MSANIIQSDYTALQQVSHRFTRRAEHIREVHRSITHQARKLSATWEGHAAYTFEQELYTVLLPALQRLSKSLDRSGVVTGHIAHTLQQAEEAAARLFTGQGRDATSEIPDGITLTEKLDSPGEPVVRHRTHAQREQGTGDEEEGQSDGYRIEDIDQTELSVFFSQYENNENISDEVLDQYLTNPELMAIQREVVHSLVERVQNGEPPLTPDAFYQLVLAETGDPGTALIICHNVLKSLSRGYSPIGWEIVDRDRAGQIVYAMNGEEFSFDPSTFHPDAMAEANGNPSVFYTMFSAEALGTEDSGDWYHFYLEASVTYYGATGQIEFDDSSAWKPNYEEVVDETVDSLMNQMRAGMSRDDRHNDAVMAWTYANTLSFTEGAYYGDDYNGTQAEVLRESNLHREGALFGLELAGVAPNDNMIWYVPTMGSMERPSTVDVVIGDFGADLEDDTHVMLDASGEPLTDNPNNDDTHQGDNSDGRDDPDDRDDSL